MAACASALGVVAGIAFGGAGAAAVAGAVDGGNVPLPRGDLMWVGVGGVLAGVAAAGRSAFGAIRTPATGK